MKDEKLHYVLYWIESSTTDIVDELINLTEFYPLEDIPNRKQCALKMQLIYIANQFNVPDLVKDITTDEYFLLNGLLRKYLWQETMRRNISPQTHLSYHEIIDLFSAIANLKGCEDLQEYETLLNKTQNDTRTEYQESILSIIQFYQFHTNQVPENRPKWRLFFTELFDKLNAEPMRSTIEWVIEYFKEVENPNRPFLYYQDSITIFNSLTTSGFLKIKISPLDFSIKSIDTDSCLQHCGIKIGDTLISVDNVKSSDYFFYKPLPLSPIPIVYKDSVTLQEIKFTITPTSYYDY